MYILCISNNMYIYELKKEPRTNLLLTVPGSASVVIYIYFSFFFVVCRLSICL